jgi:hypothetical protein
VTVQAKETAAGTAALNDGTPAKAQKVSVFTLDQNLFITILSGQGEQLLQSLNGFQREGPP